MHTIAGVRYTTVLLMVWCLGATVVAEKELMYDPVKGIVFVEKQDSDAAASPSPLPSVKKPVARASSSADIHTGRKKDPPDLYFKSGLEYYKNSDFTNALKNFLYADSLEHRPEYALLIGKTMRRLGQMREMIKMMFDIVKIEAESDVADDALLELALYYQAENDYDKSMQLFTKITDMYPFGTVYATGEEISEIAREQRRLMRAEMINLLSLLGYSGVDLQESYRKFQQAKGLSVTETGDPVTIKTLRTLHREYLAREADEVAKQGYRGRFVFLLYGSLAGGAVNLLLLVVVMIKTQTYQRHLRELRQVVADLDVKKI